MVIFRNSLFLEILLIFSSYVTLMYNTKLKLRKVTYAFPMPHQCKKRKKDKYLPRIYLPFVGFLTQTTAADFLHMCIEVLYDNN
jgi:hypothetical protein